VPVRGSSPPARGRVDAALDAVETAGFIPACAGESCAGRLPPCGPGVHPRLRGGETAMHAAAASAGGSSPPARGRDCDARRGGFGWGFIPACAGERGVTTTLCQPMRVHPRLRGGEPSAVFNSMFNPGSSPPARGRGRSRPGNVNRIGFIPACAGERVDQYTADA